MSMSSVFKRIHSTDRKILEVKSELVYKEAFLITINEILFTKFSLVNLNNENVMT